VHGARWTVDGRRYTVDGARGTVYGGRGTRLGGWGFGGRLLFLIALRGFQGLEGVFFR
jgi:hypothetical protein